MKMANGRHADQRQAGCQKQPLPQTGARRSAPAIRSMSCVPYIWPRRPAAKKASALQSEWLSVWKSAREGARGRPAPAQRDDAHVLDAVVGEQALDVALEDDERRRHQDRDQRRRPPAAAGPAGMPGRALDQRQVAQDAVERGVEHEAGEERRDRRRRLAVRVGQPAVHRRQARLGAVADQQEDEGRPSAAPGRAAPAAAQSCVQSSVIGARAAAARPRRRPAACP